MTDPNIREGQIVDDAREAVSEKMSEMWWTFLLRGLLASGFGSHRSLLANWERWCAHMDCGSFSGG